MLLEEATCLRGAELGQACEVIRAPRSAQVHANGSNDGREGICGAASRGRGQGLVDNGEKVADELVQAEVQTGTTPFKH